MYYTYQQVISQVKHIIVTFCLDICKFYGESVTTQLTVFEEMDIYVTWYSQWHEVSFPIQRFTIFTINANMLPEWLYMNCEQLHTSETYTCKAYIHGYTLHIWFCLLEFTQMSSTTINRWAHHCNTVASCSDSSSVKMHPNWMDPGSWITYLHVNRFTCHTVSAYRYLYVLWRRKLHNVVFKSNAYSLHNKC